LKFVCPASLQENWRLLIAPKGIEIPVYIVSLQQAFLLLIAPKGIEIALSCCVCFVGFVLLIAPKGIEISLLWLYLIVFPLSFNRTKRN